MTVARAGQPSWLLLAAFATVAVLLTWCSLPHNVKSANRWLRDHGIFAFYWGVTFVAPLLAATAWLLTISYYLLRIRGH